MLPKSTEIKDLLRQARRGDAAAVDQLLASHRESIRRMIGLRLDPAIAPRADASDIVQEVLLEASQRLRDYLRNPGMPFHLWLRHLARDHVIDAHRRHRLAQRRSVDREQSLVPARPDSPELDVMAQIRDPEPTPASAVLRQELEKHFQNLIARMEEGDREIILMRHFEHLTNQEAAMTLGLSEAAASMRHLRALRRLRAMLAGGG